MIDTAKQLLAAAGSTKSIGRARHERTDQPATIDRDNGCSRSGPSAEAARSPHRAPLERQRWSTRSSANSVAVVARKAECMRHARPWPLLFYHASLRLMLGHAPVPQTCESEDGSRRPAPPGGFSRIVIPPHQIGPYQWPKSPSHPAPPQRGVRLSSGRPERQIARWSIPSLKIFTVAMRNKAAHV